MQATANHAPVIVIRLSPRLIIACAVIVAAAVWTVIMLNQPPIGSFRGVCRDAKTGKPLAGIFITVSQPGPPDGSEGDDDEPHTPFASDDPFGRSGPPVGWAQGTKEDDSVNMAGNADDNGFSITVKTDANGAFTVSNLIAGTYDINSFDSVYELDRNNYQAVVEPGKPEVLTLDFNRVAPTIDFDDPEPNWLPTEIPDLGLTGTLTCKAVTLTLERIDIADAKAHAPDGLLPGRAESVTPSGPNGQVNPKFADWGGKYTVVRSWTHTLQTQESQGQFFDHIVLFDKPLPVGAYWLKAEPTGDAKGALAATARFNVTSIALVTKTAGPNIVGFVTDLATGKPESGLSATLYQNDSPKPVIAGITGADGLLHLDASKAQAESRGSLIVQRGDEIAGLSLSLNSPGSDADATDTAGGNGDQADGNAPPAGAPILRSLVYTERPVYRPGDLVHIKGIMRMYAAGSGYSVPAQQPVTIDIHDSQNNLIAHSVATTNAMGSWTSDLTLNLEALTGQYQITAALGQQNGQATFDVASYHKPEYQVTVKFGKDRYVHGDTVHATITASYYYGAPVGGAKTHITVDSANAPGDDSDGSGDDDTSDSTDDTGDSGQPTVDEDVILDQQGQAQIDFPTTSQPNQENGVDYTLTATVADPSGESIAGNGTVTVAQGDFALDLGASYSVAGVGQAIVVTATATNPDTKPRAGQLVVVQPSYDVWNDDNEVKVKLAPMHGVTDSGGIARFPFTVPKTGVLDFDGSGKDSRGNTVTHSTTVWVSGIGGDLPAHYSDLQIVLDKKQYKIGDTVHALVNTDHPGASALVTVEGSKLYQAYVVPMARHSTEIDIALTPDLAPGVTLSVSCIVDKQFLTSSGTANITDTRRPLTIAVSSDKAEYHPGDVATLSLRTTDFAGKAVPAEVSVGVVDSAIYAIEEDSTPSIVDAFEPDQGNAVQTADSCDRVYYGDVDKGASATRIRSKFVDTALWAPDVMTGPDGTGRVTLTLPDNLTTWRVTCFGHTADTQVGTARTTFEVNKDLLVRIETPAFLTAGDQATIVGLVHNNTKQAVHAHVVFSAAGLAVLDTTTDDVDVEPGAPARLTWRVRADHPGAASVTMTAAGSGLGDGMELPIPVDPHGVFLSTWGAGTLRHGATTSFTIDPRAIPDSTTLRIHLAPSLASAILPGIDSLSAYPYDNVEQSAAVLTGDAILAGACRSTNGGAPVVELSPNRRARLDDEVRRCVLRMQRMQNSQDGGWGWFQGSSSDLWDSEDVAWSLVLAKQAHYQVPDSLMSAAMKATSDQASAERSNPWHDIDDVAMAAMVLARGGKREAALNNLIFLHDHWNRNPVDNQSLALCALAYAALDGPRDPSAVKPMNDLWADSRVTGAERSWTREKHTAAGVGQFLPDDDTTAWAMLAAQTIDPGDLRVDGIARWVIEDRKGDNWGEPMCTSLVLLALTNYLESSQEMQPNFSADLLINGKLIQTTPFGPDSINEPDTLIDVPMSDFGVGKNTIQFDKRGDGRLYYSVEVRQCLAQPPPPDPPSLLTRLWRAFVVGEPKLPPAQSGFRVKRQYLRLTSRRNAIWEDTVPAPDTEYNPDETIEVRLIIDAIRPVSRMVIREPIPAGCEPTDLMYDECDDWTNWWDYTDIKDDKVTFFVSDMSTGTHEIDYHLTVKTPGEFDVMPTSLTSTVDPSVQAQGTTSHITVDGRSQ